MWFDLASWTLRVEFEGDVWVIKQAKWGVWNKQWKAPMLGFDNYFDESPTVVTTTYNAPEEEMAS